MDDVGVPGGLVFRLSLPTAAWTATLLTLFMYDVKFQRKTYTLAIYHLLVVKVRLHWLDVTLIMSVWCMTQYTYGVVIRRAKVGR